MNPNARLYRADYCANKARHVFYLWLSRNNPEVYAYHRRYGWFTVVDGYNKTKFVY